MFFRKHKSKKVSNDKKKSLLDMSGEFLRQHKYENAIAALDEILELDSKDSVAWYTKGLTFILMDKSDEETLICFENSLKINPKNADAWQRRGKLLNKFGKYSEALKSFEKALKIDHDNYKALSNKGFSFMKLKNYQEAINCYDNVLKLKPDYFNAWYFKGFALLGLINKNEEATFCFEKALTLNPQNANAWYGKGLSFEQLKMPEDALKCYERALKLNPDLKGAKNARKNILSSKS